MQVGGGPNTKTRRSSRGRRIFFVVFACLVLWMVVALVVATIGAIGAHREVVAAEERLRVFLDHPPARVEVLSGSPGEPISFGEVFLGKLLGVAPLLQLMADTGGLEADYWKPGYAVTADALWRTDLPPLAACRQVARSLGHPAAGCAPSDRKECLQNLDITERTRRSCYRRFAEGGYFLPRVGSSLMLDEGILGGMRFKRGRVAQLGGAEFDVRRIGPPDQTVIQIWAEGLVDL